MRPFLVFRAHGPRRHLKLKLSVLTLSQRLFT
eukprot:COSAG06_NODE_45469_length_354_cov_1.341176_1_plen_31_part_10